MVDPDADDPEVWRFVVILGGKEVPGSTGVLRLQCGGAISPRGERAEWFLTAALFVRAATSRTRIC